MASHVLDGRRILKAIVGMGAMEIVLNDEAVIAWGIVEFSSGLCNAAVMTIVG